MPETPVLVAEVVSFVFVFVFFKSLEDGIVRAESRTSWLLLNLLGCLKYSCNLKKS